MKTEEFRKKLIESTYLMKWVNGNWKWNNDGSVDVEGNVEIRNYPYQKLPFKFRKVVGYFDCANNILETLEGCPEYLEGGFTCRGNKLKSLIGSPNKVDGFWCYNNQLETLDGSPNVVLNAYSCYGNATRFTKKDVKKVCNVMDECMIYV